MATAHSVKIGPNYFKNEFRDYANWQFAVVRELYQNGRDAPGTKNMEYKIYNSGENTVLEFSNDGEPMDYGTITDKLFTLGESGKNFENTVGGFGKAKLILYMCHQSYQIVTGEYIVNGCGGEYDIATGPYYDGTKSIITIAGDHVEKLVKEAEKMVAFGQWSGLVTINGSQYRPSLRKGSPRRELDFGTVYSNKVFPNRLIVRINGTPMFSNYISFDRCVVVELNGSSLKTLTANRDGLRYPYSSQLSDFISELAVDKKSALRNRSASYTHYEGERCKHTASKNFDVRELVGGSDETIVTESPEEAAEQQYVENGPAVSVVTANERSTKGGLVVLSKQEAKVKVSIGSEFIIKNECGLSIPEYYTPDCFGDYSSKIARYWGRCMLKMHEVLQSDGDFAIGFVFSESAEAEHEVGPYGRVYYINPTVVVQQKNSASRSLKKRFKLTEKHRMISLAAHEFVHGQGFGPHDEAYASKLTDVMSVVLANLKEFNVCFR